MFNRTRMNYNIILAQSRIRGICIKFYHIRREFDSWLTPLTWQKRSEWGNENDSKQQSNLDISSSWLCKSNEDNMGIRTYIFWFTRTASYLSCRWLNRNIDPEFIYQFNIKVPESSAKQGINYSPLCTKITEYRSLAPSRREPTANLSSNLKTRFINGLETMAQISDGVAWKEKPDIAL